MFCPYLCESPPASCNISAQHLIIISVLLRKLSYWDMFVVSCCTEMLWLVQTCCAVVLLHWEVMTCVDMLCGSVTLHDTSSHTVHISFRYSFVFNSPQFCTGLFSMQKFYFCQDGIAHICLKCHRTGCFRTMLIPWMPDTVQNLWCTLC